MMKLVRAHLRSLQGRLSCTTGVSVDVRGTNIGSAGATQGDAKKLAAVYPAEIAETMREIAGASLAWQASGIPKAPNGLFGHLRVPDAKSMLKYGFAHYAKQRDKFPFPEDVEVTVADYHNDQQMAWLVRSQADLAVHYAAAGEEGSSHRIASSLGEYLSKGLDAWYLDYWHDPKAHLGDGLHVSEAIDLLRKLPVEKAARIEILEVNDVALSDAQAWIKNQIKAMPKNKALKAKLKALPALASQGFVRLLLEIDAPKTLGFLHTRALAVLADAPGNAPFLDACGASDPRFDWLWGREDMEAILGVEHHAKAPDDYGKGTLRAECYLTRPLVPTGATAGARYEAVVPYC